ncbi:MAG: LicD family protein [Bacteroidales bacterium]|nr:LicD family protein [Bacteroidales bacterium]
MKKIDIEQMKCVQMDILSFVHDFCVKNNIKYSLCGGSAIGAIRHKGFIPWDDDIDIFMLREDYDKLVSTFEDERGVYLVHSLKDNLYSLPFAKIEDTRTIIVEKSNMKDSLGINIDVFPVDNLLDGKDESLRLLRNIGKIRRITRVKLLKPTPKNSLIKKIGILFFSIALAPVSLRRLSIKLDDVARASGKKDSVYVSTLVWGYGEKEMVERRLFCDYLLVPFEDRQYFIMAGYDLYLRQVYGDYMQLPPEDKRQSPHSIQGIYWKDGFEE